MKQELVAIPVYQNRISPLLDVSNRYAVYEIEDNMIKQKLIVTIDTSDELMKIEKLHIMGVSTIIGGAVSGYVSRLINEKGMRLIPWITGPVDDIINLYLDKGLESCACETHGRRCRGRRAELRGMAQKKNNATNKNEDIL